MKCLPGLLLIVPLSAFAAESNEPPWTMHVIDNSSRGADGVRLGDVDQDGRVDIVTGWEEGGQIRICFQSATAAVRQPWPSIAVGNVQSPEDAVFADVNADGWLDVVSCCEGNQQAVFFHLNPGGELVRDAERWQTTMLPGSHHVTRWMFCEPLTTSDSKRQLLILGSKDPNGGIMSWTSEGSDFVGSFQTLRPAAWIMSLRHFDIDADGDGDIVFSDRKGEHRGIGWLENLASKNSDEPRWTEHPIGGTGLEVMFLDIHRLDETAAPTVVCNTKNGHLQLLTAGDDIRQPWPSRQVNHPQNTGSGKGAAIGDIDGDGRPDLVATCENAADKVGVYWLSEPPERIRSEAGYEQWDFHDISGSLRGVKYDRIELADMDGDGDLDVLTCEERDNLGVVWYENPQR